MSLFLSLSVNSLGRYCRKQWSESVKAGGSSEVSVVCVFFSFTPFLSILFVFRMEGLVLLNLISIYMTSKGEYFLKSKDIVDLCKANFDINKLFIHTTDIGCEHIPGGVNMYSYAC